MSFKLAPVDVGEVPKTAYVVVPVAVTIDANELREAATSYAVTRLARKKTREAIQNLTAKLEELPVEIDRARSLFDSKNLSSAAVTQGSLVDRATADVEKNTVAADFEPPVSGTEPLNGRASEGTGRRRTENRLSEACERGSHLCCFGHYEVPVTWTCRCECHGAEVGTPV